MEYANLPLPALYVVPLSEEAERQDPGSTENNQRTVISYGVIVALDATPDVRGQHPTHQLEYIRAALFRAIYNWAPIDSDYGHLWFDSIKLLAVNRAATFWMFTFCTYSYVCGDNGEGETEDQYEWLPAFKFVGVKVDFIDPHDPGEPPSGEFYPPHYDAIRGPPPWPTGPEGRIESEFRFEVDWEEEVAPP